MNQAYPVMLVIGTLPEDRGLDRRGDKVRIESIRWMEISSVLKRLSENGTKRVTQIEFHGEVISRQAALQAKASSIGVGTAR